jgi:hypothetical protein
MYTTIEIDFEVFKEITNRRSTEEVTPNDVLRGLLNLPPKNKQDNDESRKMSGTPWITKNISFPHGTEFKATYKGKEYSAVVNNGALEVDDNRFSSPSAAAMSITNSPVNGWVFWKCKTPGQNEWKAMKEFRQ